MNCAEVYSLGYAEIDVFFFNAYTINQFDFIW